MMRCVDRLNPPPISAVPDTRLRAEPVVCIRALPRYCSAMISTRPGTADDAPDLAALLNAIIAIGGTTALEVPFSADAFAETFITGAKCLSCQVAVAPDGSLAGFQVLAREAWLPAGWGDIGTFARPEPRLRGVGSALFPATVAVARGLGLTAINATIRGDNVPGLAYYAGLGFKDDRRVPGHALRDGTVVDKIWRRYSL
jgi:L-amino acid N-acyltransferase YncA